MFLHNINFYKKKEDPIFNSPSIVIEVTDINKTINEIKIAGGKVLGQPMEIPGIGTYVSFIDSEGNRSSFLKSNWNN